MYLQPFHETKLHGTPDFPYIVYHGKMPDFLTSYPLHWHDEFEIIYIIEGQMKVTVWSDTFIANKGDIILLMSNTMHALEQIDSVSVEYFNILFHFSILYSSETDTCYQKYIMPFLLHEKTISYHKTRGSELNTLLTPLILSLIEYRRQSYSTHECLVNYRLEIAARQLTETDSSIIEVASNCGFNNHSYFTRAFVNKYGTTPRNYRHTN